MQQLQILSTDAVKNSRNCLVVVSSSVGQGPLNMRKLFHPNDFPTLVTKRAAHKKPKIADHTRNVRIRHQLYSSKGVSAVFNGQIKLQGCVCIHCAVRVKRCSHCMCRLQCHFVRRLRVNSVHFLSSLCVQSNFISNCKMFLLSAWSQSKQALET